jgi:uncharacterized protein involved in oxidation of intracellular sulfur
LKTDYNFHVFDKFADESGRWFVTHNCVASQSTKGGGNIKVGIVVYLNDPETVWNAFRFGNFALKERETVQVFLLGKGVQSESLDTDGFNVTGQMRSFVEKGGTIAACETCLDIHHLGGTQLCPVSTLADLYDLVKESDKIVTF